MSTTRKIGVPSNHIESVFQLIIEKDLLWGSRNSEFDRLDASPIHCLHALKILVSVSFSSPFAPFKSPYWRS